MWQYQPLFWHCCSFHFLDFLRTFHSKGTKNVGRNNFYSWWVKSIIAEYFYDFYRASLSWRKAECKLSLASFHSFVTKLFTLKYQLPRRQKKLYIIKFYYFYAKNFHFLAASDSLKKKQKVRNLKRVEKIRIISKKFMCEQAKIKERNEMNF